MMSSAPQSPLSGRSASRNDPHYLDKSILFSKECADALETAAHMDVEVLLAWSWGHIVGVRIEGAGNCVESKRS